MKKIIGLLVGVMMLTACGSVSEEVNEIANKSIGEEPGLVVETAASVLPETNYYTLEVVDTNLTPREWLDAAYKDYSGKWAWEFKSAIFAYEDENNQYEGFFAYRDEAAMYVEYRLVPLDGKLFVFKREAKMPDLTTVEGRQEESLHVAELASKIKNYKAK